MRQASPRSREPRCVDGIREAGGVPSSFPSTRIQETCKRPHRSHSIRNLQYLSLVEILYGYPLDGVVLTSPISRDAETRGASARYDRRMVIDIAAFCLTLMLLILMG